MQITDNNRADAISKNMIRISKSNIRILRMRLQLLQITVSTSTCKPLSVSVNGLNPTLEIYKKCEWLI
jgi:hypothetical protein